MYKIDLLTRVLLLFFSGLGAQPGNHMRAPESVSRLAKLFQWTRTLQPW
jgi:hypothetical protein